MAKSNIRQTILPLAEKAAAENGVELWDVEFVREGGEYFLRLYIDREGGVSIEDCEAVSKTIDPMLDEADPIEQSYNLEVSSPGIFRELKTDEHFRRSVGSCVRIKLYAPIGGSKQLTGTLTGVTDGELTLEADGEAVTVPRSAVAGVRIHEELDF